MTVETRHSTPSLDEASRPNRELDTHRVGVLTDLHIGPPELTSRWNNELDIAGACERFAVALGEFRRLDCDLVVLLGDLSHLGDETTLRRIAGLAAEAAMPVRVVPGNHDCTSGTSAFAAAFESRDRSRGDVMPAPRGPQPIAGLRLCGVHIASSDGGRTAGTDEVDVSHWPPGLVVLLTHYPVLDIAAELEKAGLQNSGMLNASAASFRRLIARSEPTLVLNGHLHVRAEKTFGGILQVSSAALAEAPYEASIVDLSRGDHPDVRVRRYVVPPANPVATEVLPWLSGHVEHWRWNGRRWFQPDSR